MAQVKLINRAKIAEYKQISDSVHNDKLNECIVDAQKFDVRPLLGEKLYNAIIADASAYTELLDGGNYTVDGDDYFNEGLAAVIVYYAYARYRMFGGEIDTPFSVVEKLNGSESRPVSESQRKTQYNLNRDSAFQMWENVRQYLIRTEEPLFDTCKSQAPKRGLKITKL